MNSSLTLKVTGYDDNRSGIIFLGIKSFEATFQVDPKEYLGPTLHDLYANSLSFNVEDAKKNYIFHHLDYDNGADFEVTEDDHNIKIVSCCYLGAYDPEEGYIVYHIDKEKLYSYLKTQLENKNYSFHMNKFYITFDYDPTHEIFPICGQNCIWNGEEHVKKS